MYQIQLLNQTAFFCVKLFKYVLKIIVELLELSE